MPPDNRNAAEELFRELETQLAGLRASAKSLRDEKPSWADNTFHPGRRARREADFDVALGAVLRDFCTSVRQALEQQQARIAGLEREIAELRSGGGELEQLRQQQERLAGEQSEAGKQATEGRARAAELQQRVEELGRDYAAKIEQLAGGQANLTNEFRERLQNVLDEQRVSIRQLALKASEDAVLSDRARRAAELKLEELAKRLPPA